MNKRNLYKLVVMFISIALPLITLAQGPDDPQDVPIDGGLSWLIAVGATYGIKKYRNDRKKKTELDMR